VILNFVHSFANLVYNPLLNFYSFLADNMGFTVFYIILGTLYIPFVDFLTAVTLLYLFYYQGMHSMKKKSPKDPDSKRGAAIISNISEGFLRDST